MNWLELNSLWQEQRVAAGEPLRASEIEAAFRAKHRKLAAVFFWRDVREGMAGLLVAGVFGYVGYYMGPQGWPLSFAILVVLGVSAFFVRERFRARSQRPPLDAPVIVCVDAEIAEQLHQRELLLSVGRWYVAPILGAAAIFSATVLVNAPLPLVPKLIAAAFSLVVCAGCAWGVLALNRAAVRRVIDPRLQELKTIKATFVSP